MILCAGLGTRLQELTKDTPKPMLPINGKPILEYTIEHLSGLGIKRLIVNLHYLPEKITSYFGNGNKWGVSIDYSYEKEPLGTAGALKKVSSMIKDDVLLLYGDVICNEDYNALFDFHKSRPGSVASIVLHERKLSNSVVEMDKDQLITRFIERPEKEVADKKQDWVNSGLYCFSKKILEFIPEKVYCDFPKDIFPALVEKKLIYGYPLKGYRKAIDSIERYKEIQEDFRRMSIFK